MPLAGFDDIDLCTTAAALPGAGVLSYAPLDEVDTAVFDEESLLLPDYNMQAPAGVPTWYNLPYVQGAASWSEDQQGNDQGEYFRVSVSVQLPADTPQVRGELNAMRHRRFLLRLQRNGHTILIGTPEQPLRFSSRFESGSEGGDFRGHRLDFTGNSLRKSPGYVPVF